MKSELQKATVIPDSIDPVVGWKALYLINNSLYSPQKGTRWPHRKPLKAKCSGNGALQGVWKMGRFGSYSPDDMFLEMMNSPIYIPDPPQGPLPFGMEWQLHLERVEHDVASGGCGCGIYITDDLRYAAEYAEILVRVAGWGTTTKHARGYRVEYAYPQEIYVSNEHERKLVSGYGVPVILRSDAPEYFNRKDEPVSTVDPGYVGVKSLTLAILIGQVFIQSALLFLNRGVFHAIMAAFSLILLGAFTILARFPK